MRGNGKAPPPTPDESDQERGYVRSFVDWEALEDAGEPPARDWALDHWLGMGYTTLLAAKGGMGKSIFAQQLATALAIKRNFVAAIDTARAVLCWLGEDDDNEIWRRQHAICRRFEVPMSDLRSRLSIESMTDTDCCLLAKVIGAGMVRTGMLRELREQIGDLKAEVVVLDNVAKMFTGNENDRGEVTAFLTALAWAAKPTGAAVLLISHVSKGLNSEFSGSTAWENAVRSRWWLTDHPPDKEQSQEDSEASDLRYLAKRKVNYTSRDLCILKYEEGAYNMVSGLAEGGLMGTIRRNVARRVITTAMTQMDGKGIYGNESSGSPTYLPKVILQYNLGEGYTRQELTTAMRAMIMDGTLVRAEIGQYQNRTPKFALIVRPT